MKPDPFLRCDPAYRFQDMYPTRKPQCAFCSNALPPGRRRWCSDQCATNASRLFYIRKGESGFVRRAIQVRDAGLCRDCGTFCQLFETRYWTDDHSLCPLDVRGFRQQLYHIAVKPWQAHHIVAIAEGGGGCDLDGYITLCTSCHGKHTGALNRRLNRGKAPQMQLAIS